MENVDGAEFDAERFFLPEWAVYANVAFTDGEDTTTDAPLPYYSAAHRPGGCPVRPSCRVMGVSRETGRCALRGMESGTWATLNVRAGFWWAKPVMR